MCLSQVALRIFLPTSFRLYNINSTEPVDPQTTVNLLIITGTADR